MTSWVDNLHVYHYTYIYSLLLYTVAIHTIIIPFYKNLMHLLCRWKCMVYLSCAIHTLYIAAIGLLLFSKADKSNLLL